MKYKNYRYKSNIGDALRVVYSWRLLWTYYPKRVVNILRPPRLLPAIGPSFARSGHMVRNKLCWDTNNAVELSKQRKVGLDWWEFLCFGSDTALFASQDNLFPLMWPDRAKGLIGAKNTKPSARADKFLSRAFFKIITIDKIVIFMIKKLNILCLSD